MLVTFALCEVAKTTPSLTLSATTFASCSGLLREETDSVPPSCMSVENVTCFFASCFGTSRDDLPRGVTDRDRTLLELDPTDTDIDLDDSSEAVHSHMSFGLKQLGQRSH